MPERRDARVCLVTAPDAETAERIARALVEERLAACGNVVQELTSVYRWQGVVERAQEVLLLLKTTVDAVPELIRRVSELHPYEVPEVLVLAVDAGLEPYLDWIDMNVKQEGED